MKLINSFLEGKEKDSFLGKTPPEVHQEFVDQYGSYVRVNKKVLKQEILDRYGLFMKVTKVGFAGKATRIYHDGVSSFTRAELEPIVDLPREEWKDVDGYGGIYQVSTFGRVKSVRFGGEMLLKQTELNNGYLKVGLPINGTTETRLVHRLVASAFMSNPNKHPQIDHFDMDRHNNNLWNLRWVTNEQNNEYAKVYRELLKNEENQRVLAEIHRLNTEEILANEPTISGSLEALEALHYLKMGGR